MENKYKIGDRVIVYFVDEEYEENLVIGTLEKVNKVMPESEMYDFSIIPETQIGSWTKRINIFEHNILTLANPDEFREKDIERENKYH